MQNAAFTNQSGGRYKPDWGMWKDGTNFVADYYSHISHLYRSSSSFASGEIVAERELKSLNCCKYKNYLSILIFA